MKSTARTARRSLRLDAVLVSTSLLGLLAPGSAHASPQAARWAAERNGAGSSDPVPRLKGIEAAAARESRTTFRLTYVSKGSGGSSQVTIEQKPPEELFRTGTGEMVSNGKALTSYSSRVSSSDFALPRGAKITALP